MFPYMVPCYYVKVFMAVPLVPVQATDATENDINRPLVTSFNSEMTEASNFPLPNLCYSNPMSTAEARSVIWMGYSKAAVQLAIHEYNRKNPTKGALSFSAADLVQILAGRQERGEEIPQDLPSEELGKRDCVKLKTLEPKTHLNFHNRQQLQVSMRKFELVFGCLGSEDKDIEDHFLVVRRQPSALASLYITVS
ncbi:hypothetical protein DPMN_176829 [Dreissena polymorpha]|uniref:Uncharacterized protein n=1 Tax=Dreissena polymorpha TaxID=45954 RepID=A0A9D4EC39_DREPO|nr:hypothetical protein DPMN_176829 [Dreissena polymorpha]